MRNRDIQLILGILLATAFLLTGCGEQPAGRPEAAKPKAIATAAQPEDPMPEIPSASKPLEPEENESVHPQSALPDPIEDEFATEANNDDIEWGTEVDLEEMISMAKSGKIREIQWHVMPNILRAEALDNRIFHLRNENKGVDLRNALINAGVRVGKGGIIFRHVF